MSPDKQALKARLMVEAEAVIDNLLAGASEKEALQLSDIEHLACRAGRRMMERLTVGLVEAEAAGEESSICPECGQKMRYKRQKGRELVTETGVLWLHLVFQSYGEFSHSLNLVKI